jgi:hypothetical protein
MRCARHLLSAEDLRTRRTSAEFSPESVETAAEEKAVEAQKGGLRATVEAQSAVERDSCFGWRASCGACAVRQPLRRGCSISGLVNSWAVGDEPIASIGTIPRHAKACDDDEQQTLNEQIQHFDDHSPTTLGLDDQSDAVTESFLQLTDLPTSPLDRLIRYEATLWWQACQIPWTLCLDRRKPHGRGVGHRKSDSSGLFKREPFLNQDSP